MKSDEDFSHDSLHTNLLHTQRQKGLVRSETFFSKRTHPNKFHKSDCSKTCRVAQHTHATMDLETTLGIEDIITLITFVEASFAAHDNMRVNAGVAITIGAFMSESKTQSLRTKKITDCELVGVGDSITRLARTFFLTHKAVL